MTTDEYAAAFGPPRHTHWHGRRVWVYHPLLDEEVEESVVRMAVTTLWNILRVADRRVWDAMCGWRESHRVWTRAGGFYFRDGWRPTSDAADLLITAEAGDWWCEETADDYYRLDHHGWEGPARAAAGHRSPRAPTRSPSPGLEAPTPAPRPSPLAPETIPLPL